MGKLIEPFSSSEISIGTAGLDPQYVDAHKKMIYRRTRRVTTIPRPLLENSRRGESKSALAISVKFILTSYFLKQVKIGSQQK